MTRLLNQWKFIAVMSLILPIIACTGRPPQSQSQMMAADAELRSRLQDEEVVKQQMLFLEEPSMYEVSNNMPPSAMLRDQERPAAFDAPESANATEKPQPISMPTEPRPR